MLLSVRLVSPHPHRSRALAAPMRMRGRLAPRVVAVLCRAEVVDHAVDAPGEIVLEGHDSPWAPD
jgi:hypothetical protein